MKESIIYAAIDNRLDDGYNNSCICTCIAICIANYKSVQAANAQYLESKRQFDESRRLQIMPYLQVTISPGEFQENGQPVTPYSIFEISKPTSNKLDTLLSISFDNVGLGMLHHTAIYWNSISKHKDKCPEEDVVMVPHIPWKMNCLFTAEGSEIDDIHKPDHANCSIDIFYEDLAGNKYSQHIKMIFLIYYSEIKLLYYHIIPPVPEFDR